MLERFDSGTQTILTDYLSEVVGEKVELQPCLDRRLPLFLAQSYAFACGSLFGTECVFVTPSDGETKRPIWHAKQQAKISADTERPVVLVLNTLPSRDRQRLIQQRVPFIVPFKQMFLPPLGIDFRDWAHKKSVSRTASQAIEPLTPTTQLILLHALLDARRRELRSEELVDELGVSAMSVSRAFRDLQAAGLMSRRQLGRKLMAQLADEPRVVWERAQPFLSTPVRRRYTTVDQPIPSALEAGATALARISSLAGPAEPTVAVGTEVWRKLRSGIRPDPIDDPIPEPGEATVEVWTYSPTALSQGPSVDSLSLYLSLRDQRDERVELALKEAMEQVWQ